MAGGGSLPPAASRSSRPAHLLLATRRDRAAGRSATQPPHMGSARSPERWRRSPTRSSEPQQVDRLGAAAAAQLVHEDQLTIGVDAHYDGAGPQRAEPFGEPSRPHLQLL